MKFSENWLREWVDVPVDRARLAHALTMAGLEVEVINVLGEGLEGVVIAMIVATEKHPQADRLQVCKVDSGQHEPWQIVCGAPNVRVGIKVPLATVGSRLPTGTKINAVSLRGVKSSGMLCSARELGIDADASGLLELPADAPLGAALGDYLGLPDASFEVKLTPNRSDCLSLIGLAHDVAALFDCKMQRLEPASVVVAGSARRGIRLEAGQDAPRYLGRIIEGIDPFTCSPNWLTQRLRLAGLRPVNVVVDVTHYVMLEMGQPLHAFDNARIKGDIVVRHARAGETLRLLDGKTVSLDETFVLVADECRALAIAGVMGGYDSRVTDTTSQIWLEAAHFAPAAVMGRARRLGLHTDASHRFERGVDPQLPHLALARASELLLSIAGGQAGPVVVAEQVDNLPLPVPVRLRRARLRRMLGIAVSDTEVLRILSALGMQVTPVAEGWTVIAPSRRFDIEREEDLIEEVARIFGYDRIPTASPAGALTLMSEPETRIDTLRLREHLATRGYVEAVNLSFVSADLLADWSFCEQAVALANPLSGDLALLRPLLLPNLMEAVRHNHARQQKRVRLFEIGRTFASAQVPLETPSLALAAAGTARAEQWGETARTLDFFDIKGELDALLNWGGEPQRWTLHRDDLPNWLHPGRGARVCRDGVTVGYLGALHPNLAASRQLGPDVYVLEVTLAALLNRHIPQAQLVARYPSVRRDIAIEVPEQETWLHIETVVRDTLGPLLKELRLFDHYRGKGVERGHKSIAIGLILQDVSRTLTDEDASRSVHDVVAALEKTCMARWRE